MLPTSKPQWEELNLKRLVPWFTNLIGKLQKNVWGTGFSEEPSPQEHIVIERRSLLSQHPTPAKDGKFLLSRKKAQSAFGLQESEADPGSMI